MLLSLWPNWWEDWEYQWKCTFIGETKEIIINPGSQYISVKKDLYSAWKEWSSVRDNMKFSPAIRSVGGDPISDGLYAGDIYFLTNDRKVIVKDNVIVDGVLFNDIQGKPPYVVAPGGGVISNVSTNLLQTVVQHTREMSRDLAFIRKQVKQNEFYILAQ